MKPKCFQDIILTLHRFWAARGCVILQPYDMRMGAGTFHPATTLRALGPKPWKAAYVQPSRRPSDGRYGENPNRLQHYYQYQVILKPSPADLQELYLGSLAAIGIAVQRKRNRMVAMPARRIGAVPLPPGPTTPVACASSIISTSGAAAVEIAKRSRALMPEE